MIDYEKLNMANSLAEKYVFKTGNDVEIIHKYYKDKDKDQPYFSLNLPNEHTIYHFHEIDLLLNYLKELVCSPKHRIGDELWGLLNKNQIYIVKIVGVNGDCSYVDEEGNTWEENELFPTQESLIDCQLKFWKNLDFSAKNKTSFTSKIIIKEDESESVRTFVNANLNNRNNINS